MSSARIFYARYSPSGEVFNCQSESLAAECASRLAAAKIVFLTEGEQLIDTRPAKLRFTGTTDANMSSGRY